MPVEDKQLALRARKEVIKRQGIQSTFIEVSAIKGVVTLRGALSRVRGPIGADLDLEKEMEIIEQNIRTIPGVRDVRNELRIR